MKTPAFIPNGYRYLVIPDELGDKEVSVGEFTITQTKDQHEKAIEGTIAAVGDDSECKYVINDRVLFGKYSGYPQNIDGAEYLILQESEILGKRIITPFD